MAEMQYIFNKIFFFFKSELVNLVSLLLALTKKLCNLTKTTFQQKFCSLQNETKIKLFYNNVSFELLILV